MTRRLNTRRNWLVWLAVIPLALWALVRAFGLESDTDLAPLMAFTPWAAIAALLVFGIAAALENWAAMIVATVSLVILAAAVLPRAFGSGEEPPAGATRLTVLSANLYFGKANPKALLGLVRKHRPDALAVQELTPELARALDRVGLRRLLPHAVLALPTHGLGRGIYSRLPLHRLRNDNPSPNSMPPVALRLAKDQVIRMIDVHPHSPQPGRVGIWANALERLPAGDSPGPPWLLLGDFNATLDQAALKQVLDNGYRDAGEMSGMSLNSTWPLGKVVPPLITIDHVLAGERIGVADYGVEDLPGSDHRAIWADVFLRSGS